MCTPDGFLYSREAILESLLQQKKANKRKLAAWEAQQQDELRKARAALTCFPAVQLHVPADDPCAAKWHASKTCFMRSRSAPQPHVPVDPLRSQGA
jgi:hypothetical protein